jgi:zinc protease
MSRKTMGRKPSCFTLTLLLAGTLIFSSFSAAQEIPEIAFDEFYLDNGLRVIVHQDRKAPIVAVTIWYHVGSKNELPGKTGFAHLFEHLMFNGTENYNNEYFAPFQEVGATSINGTTDFDRTNYFQTVPSTAVDLALWMESDRMGHLLGAIDQEKLDEQRGVVQNEKRRGENQPYGRVFEVILANLFPQGHPYSWPIIGSMDDLNAATLEDVKTWFETYYGPNNATLVLAGDIDVETARDRVQHFFGDIPPGPPLTHRNDWTLAELDEKRIRMQDRVPQARIYKTWRGPNWSSNDSALMQLADYVLTSGKTSRLYNRLVYQDQIASDVGAFSLDQEIGGGYVVLASALPGVDLATIEMAIDEELDRFRQNGPTRAELDRVRTEIQASFIRGIEQVGGFSGKSNILAMNAVYGGRPDFYRDALAAMRDATPRDVSEAFNRWVTGNAVTLEVVPFDGTLSAAPVGADRSGPPMPDRFPTAAFPELSRATLSNGLKLVVAERHAVPIVQLSLQLEAGYAADQFGKLGGASLAMGMLDEGTASRDALEISDTLAGLGASLESGSNLDMSFVSMSTLSETLDDSLEIYADVILNPAFPEADLERMRRLQLSQIEQEKVTPQSMALRVFPRLLYGGEHAYGMGLTGSGTQQSVMSINRSDLVDFHNAWFKPNNATLIVTGDVTLAEIQPRLEALFSQWDRGDTPAKTLPLVEPQTRPRVFLMDRPGSEQSYILAGQLVDPIVADTEFAMEAMNDILGGSFTSRINMNLREDKGWSYGVSSQVANTKAQRLFLVLAPVQSDQTAQSMTEIANEISAYLGDRPARDEEVATSKKRSTLSLPGRWETARAVSRDIAQIIRFDLPDNYWDDYVSGVAEVDTESVTQIARETLALPQLTWIVVGVLDEIRPQIEALNFGELTVIDSDGAIVNAP